MSLPFRNRYEAVPGNSLAVYSYQRFVVAYGHDDFLDDGMSVQISYRKLGL